MNKKTTTKPKKAAKPAPKKATPKDKAKKPAPKKAAAPAALPKGDSFRIDPSKLEFENGFNVRIADKSLQEHIDRLEQAMLQGAFIPPIDVRFEDGKVIVVDGHSRTTAALRVKKELPDYTLEARKFRGNEQERCLHMLGTGSGQKALSPLEQGIAYLRLTRYGMKPTEIATKLGVTRVTVDNGLALAEASPEVHDLVRSGQVSSTTALTAVKKGKAGVAALTKAAKEAPKPTTKKGKESTKKKVTAKTLKGTAAEKKPKSKKAAPTMEIVSHAEAKPAIAADEIAVTIKKAIAASVIDFIRANAPDDAQDLKDFASMLEMAQM